MKKLAVFLVALFFLGTTLAMGQPVPGKKFELGASLSYTSLKSSGGGTDSVLVLPVRFGYFVWKGLEIEPEVFITSFDPGGAGFNLNGNVAYHFKVAGRLVPFVLAGVGVGNGFTAGLTVYEQTDATAFLINGGVGAKYVIGNVAAFRAEYRYTHNRMTKGGGLLIQNLNIHQILVGLSVFF